MNLSTQIINTPVEIKKIARFDDVSSMFFTLPPYKVMNWMINSMIYSNISFYSCNNRVATFHHNCLNTSSQSKDLNACLNSRFIKVERHKWLDS